MSYFDYVDYPKLHQLALEMAISRALDMHKEDKIKEDEIIQTTLAMVIDCRDEIWLMGPVPMKEGWNPPTMDKLSSL